MQVECVNNYHFNSKQKTFNTTNNIGFQGVKRNLIAISADSFKTESAQKIYSKIQRYFQLIGEFGSIKDCKILPEKTKVKLSKFPFTMDADANVCLTINKGERNSIIKLYHKYSDAKNKDADIFEVVLDKNGQMINGQFLPYDNLLFERNNNNIRRMYSPLYGETFLPVGGNDREWLCTTTSEGKRLSLYNLTDNTEQGAFEIFLELARLKTVIN